MGTRCEAPAWACLGMPGLSGRNSGSGLGGAAVPGPFSPPHQARKGSRMPADTAIAAKEVKDRFLVEPYNNWAAGEGIPIHVDFGLDLLALETKRWDRYDARGCFAHCHGRGDFMANYVLE